MSVYNRINPLGLNPHLLAISLFAVVMLFGPGLYSFFGEENFASAYKAVYSCFLVGLVGYFFAFPLSKGDRAWFWAMGAYRKNLQRNVGIVLLLSCILIPFILLYFICYIFAILMIWFSESLQDYKQERQSDFIYLCNQEKMVSNNDNGIYEIKENSKKKGIDKMGKKTADIEQNNKGQNVLVSDKILEKELRDFPLSQIKKLRIAAYNKLEGIEERINPQRPYLAIYCPQAKIDFCYFYFQKKGIVVDLRLPGEQKSEVAMHGFAIRRRNNWQGKSNWITGIRIPYDDIQFDEVEELIHKAYLHRFKKI